MAIATSSRSCAQLGTKRATAHTTNLNHFRIMRSPTKKFCLEKLAVTLVEAHGKINSQAHCQRAYGDKVVPYLLGLRGQGGAVLIGQESIIGTGILPNPALPGQTGKDFCT